MDSGSYSQHTKYGDNQNEISILQDVETKPTMRKYKYMTSDVAHHLKLENFRFNILPSHVDGSSFNNYPLFLVTTYSSVQIAAILKSERYLQQAPNIESIHTSNREDPDFRVQNFRDSLKILETQNEQREVSFLELETEDRLWYPKTDLRPSQINQDTRLQMTEVSPKRLEKKSHENLKDNLRNFSQDELLNLANSDTEALYYLMNSRIGYKFVISESKFSKKFRNRVQELCLLHFKEFITKEYQSKIIKKISKLDFAFSEEIAKLFDTHSDYVLTTQTGLDLLGSIVVLLRDKVSLYFLCKYFKVNLPNPAYPFVMKMIRSILHRSSFEKLNDIAEIIKSSISWIIDKPAGSFLITSLMTLGIYKVQLAFEVSVKNHPIQLFVRKYRRQILIFYLKQKKRKQEILVFILEKIIKKRTNLRYILEQSGSMWLLFALICRMEEIHEEKLIVLRNQSLKISKNKPDLGSASEIETFIKCIDLLLMRNYCLLEKVLSQK